MIYISPYITYYIMKLKDYSLKRLKKAFQLGEEYSDSELRPLVKVLSKYPRRDIQAQIRAIIFEGENEIMRELEDGIKEVFNNYKAGIFLADQSIDNLEQLVRNYQEDMEQFKFD